MTNAKSKSLSRTILSVELQCSLLCNKERFCHAFRVQNREDGQVECIQARIHAFTVQDDYFLVGDKMVEVFVRDEFVRKPSKTYHTRSLITIVMVEF